MDPQIHRPSVLVLTSAPSSPPSPFEAAMAVAADSFKQPKPTTSSSSVAQNDGTNDEFPFIPTQYYHYPIITFHSSLH
jgi:hypothetical protein